MKDREGSRSERPSGISDPQVSVHPRVPHRLILDHSPLTTRHSFQLSMGVKGMRSPVPPRGKGAAGLGAGAVAGWEVVAGEP